MSRTVNKEQRLARYVGRYIEFFNFQRFIWQSVHGLANVELTDAQIRACIDDVCEYARQRLSIEGVPLAVDERAHLWLKDQLLKKVMGPTKDRTWVKK